jgi:hypothetical protein
VLWWPERAMSYVVATQADTSSNQASKDSCQRWCGYSNLGKVIVIKSVAAKHVAARLVAMRILPENSCFPTSSRLQ